MHAFKALLIDASRDDADVLHDALADAGCLDIDALSHDVMIARGIEAKPDVAIVCIYRGDCTALERSTSVLQGVPIVAVCDEADIDAVFTLGAFHCATRPIRRRELVGRVREALRRHAETEGRANRERKLSDAIVVLKREKQELERLVCVDPLTGIANRRHAMELLAAEWKRSVRDQSPLALVMIDLDCFHAYNETYGHPGGDACLQQVADAMVRCLRRPSDFLGRYGGEEFMAVLPHTDAVGAKIVAERLRGAVEALAVPHDASTCSPYVTITAGFAAIRVLPDDAPEKLIAAADGALLEAKRYGRNRVGGVAPLVRPSRVSAQRWERYQAVYVDPWFADRIPSFLETVHQAVRVLVDTARDGERGSGLALMKLDQHAQRFGMQTLSTLLRDLTSAVRDGDGDFVRTAADELVQYVNHVQVVYRRTVDAAGAEVVARVG